MYNIVIIPNNSNATFEGYLMTLLCAMVALIVVIVDEKLEYHNIWIRILIDIITFIVLDIIVNL